MKTDFTPAVTAAVAQALSELEGPGADWAYAANNARQSAVSAAAASSPSGLTNDDLATIRAQVNTALGNARAAQLNAQRRAAAAQAKTPTEEETAEDQRSQWKKLTHSLF